MRIREAYTPPKGYEIKKEKIFFKRVDKYGSLPRKLLKKGIRVDLGCGTGIYTRELFEPNSVVVGIDFSLGALNVAKKYFPQGKYVLGDLDYLPFKSESVNSFFSFTSIYYLTPRSQDVLFAELYRILKKKGNILLVEPNARSLIKGRENLPIHPLRESRVKKRLKEIGFKLVSIKSHSFMPRFVKRKHRKDPIYRLFSLLESVAEKFQVPFLLGSLIIYAE